MSSHARTDELFAKQCNEAITLEEWHELNELLLQEGHKYGDFMPGYLCPTCKHQLMFSWHDGAVCWHAKGGCGWHYPSPSPHALRES